MTYTATITHHSIARARTITIHGSLRAAKIAATKEFQGDFVFYNLEISDENGDVVARRKLGDTKWA